MRSAALLLLAAVLAAAGASAFAQTNTTAITATGMCEARDRRLRSARLTSSAEPLKRDTRGGTAENDVRALNYILVLENLQVAFFDTGLGNLTAEDFVLAGYNESVYNQLKLMQQQHIVRATFPPASQSPRGGMRWLTTRSHRVC